MGTVAPSPVKDAPENSKNKEKQTWGGQSDDFGPGWFQYIMVFMSPFVVLYFIATGEVANFGLFLPTTKEQFLTMIPTFKLETVPMYLGWMFFQFITYLIVPGSISVGPITPGGNKQEFKINSLQCLAVNVIVYVVCGHYLKYFDTAYISREIGSLFFTACIIGFIFSFLAYLKGLYAPTNSDAAVRNDFIQDYFLGIELSPRLPFFRNIRALQLLDSKLYIVGHCGMISWTIVNLAHMFRQLQDFGEITIGMVLVQLFQAAYTIDWAWKEEWYLFTIDMRHDRLGWYLGWGSLAWLPVTYCLQAWYLSMVEPAKVALSPFETGLILCVFFLGIVLFRLSNNQKDEFRANPNEPIWGKKPEYIEARYSTGDGKQHKSLLLCSGYWGISRHFNYASDLLICLSFSLPCRFDSLFPYWYLFYMALLLTHRSIRDDRKCYAKYGESWKEYCKKVPYVIIPYVY